MKTFLFILCVASGNLAIAGEVKLSSLIKSDGDGQTADRIQRAEAAFACDKLGMRLPTARELALDLAKNGLKIVEKSLARQEYLKAVNVVNPDGKPDSFFVDLRRYSPKNRDDYGYNLYSSSIPAEPGMEDWAFLFASDGTPAAMRERANVNDFTLLFSGKCVLP